MLPATLSPVPLGILSSFKTVLSFLQDQEAFPCVYHINGVDLKDDTHHKFVQLKLIQELQGALSNGGKGLENLRQSFKEVMGEVMGCSPKRSYGEYRLEGVGGIERLPQIYVGSVKCEG